MIPGELVLAPVTMATPGTHLWDMVSSMLAGAQTGPDPNTTTRYVIQGLDERCRELQWVILVAHSSLLDHVFLLRDPHLTTNYLPTNITWCYYVAGSHDMREWINVRSERPQTTAQENNARLLFKLISNQTLTDSGGQRDDGEQLSLYPSNTVQLCSRHREPLAFWMPALRGVSPVSAGVCLAVVIRTAESGSHPLEDGPCPGQRRFNDLYVFLSEDAARLTLRHGPTGDYAFECVPKSMPP